MEPEKTIAQRMLAAHHPLPDVDAGVRPRALRDVLDYLGDSGLAFDEHHVAVPDMFLEVIEIVRNPALVALQLLSEKADQGVGKGLLDAHRVTGRCARCGNRRRVRTSNRFASRYGQRDSTPTPAPCPHSARRGRALDRPGKGLLDFLGG